MSLLPLFNQAARSAGRPIAIARLHCSYLPSLLTPPFPATSLLSSPASSSALFHLRTARHASSFASPRPASTFDSSSTDFDAQQGVFIPARRSPSRSRVGRSHSPRESSSPSPLTSAFSQPAASHTDASPADATSTRAGAANSTGPSSASSLSAASTPASLNPDDYPMDPRLRDSLRRNFKISALFPIQATAYQPIVDGKDVLARSKTGTGKTLAFVLPLLERLKRERVVARKGEISVLVMEPTRELANQVTQEIEKLSPDTRVCAVYGGVGYGPQTDRLLRGVDVCVGTPGRLMDLLDKGACTLREVRCVVLDEADEMLRRGFKEDMESIMGYANRQRKVQMLLFSATLPEWIAQVSRQFQQEPLLIDQVTGEDNSTPLQMEHIALPAPRLLVERLKVIGELARAVRGRVILFVNSKVDADMICSSDFEDELGVDARALHGDVPQNRRDRLMQHFKAGHFKMLVATDIAARGLDIPDVQLVLQNGLPQNKEFYVHRAGRTARAGKAGKCVLLYGAKERQEVGALGRELGVSFQFQAPPTVNGETYSAVDGEPGYMTFLSQAAPNSIAPTRDDVVSYMESIVGASVQPGTVERSREAVIIDVPAAQGKQLAEHLSSGGGSGGGAVSLCVLTDLPAWLVGERKHFTGAVRGRSARGGGGGGRGGGGGGGRAGSGRGREGGGRDQRGGAYARGGDRHGSGQQSYGRGSRDGGRGGDRGGDRAGDYRSRSNSDTSYRAGSRFGGANRSDPWA